jgi:hypothetical protein
VRESAVGPKRYLARRINPVAIGEKRTSRNRRKLVANDPTADMPLGRQAHSLGIPLNLKLVNCEQTHPINTPTFSAVWDSVNCPRADHGDSDELGDTKFQDRPIALP